MTLDDRKRESIDLIGRYLLEVIRKERIGELSCYVRKIDPKPRIDPRVRWARGGIAGSEEATLGWLFNDRGDGCLGWALKGGPLLLRRMREGDKTARDENSKRFRAVGKGHRKGRQNENAGDAFVAPVSQDNLVGEIKGSGDCDAAEGERFGWLGEQVGQGDDWLGESTLQLADYDEFFLISIVLPPGEAKHDESEDCSGYDDAGARIELHGVVIGWGNKQR